MALVAGKNRFTAYAFNRDNVKSADVALDLTGAETLARAGAAYVLAIGIDEYANAHYNLKYAVADATAFGDALQREQARLGVFGKFVGVPLLNRDATRANILRAVDRLAGRVTGPRLAAEPPGFDGLAPVQPEDALFIYYAGHGTAAGPRFYLIPHDLGYDGAREALDAASLKTILAHSISDLDLEAAVETLDAGHLVLVIDACKRWTGTGGRGKTARADEFERARAARI